MMILKNVMDVRGSNTFIIKRRYFIRSTFLLFTQGVMVIKKSRTAIIKDLMEIISGTMTIKVKDYTMMKGTTGNVMAEPVLIYPHSPALMVISGFIMICCAELKELIVFLRIQRSFKNINVFEVFE